MELRAIKSYYDAHQGLVTLEDDVLSIVCQVRELYGDRIRICWEPTTEHYVFSENCVDGSERLIFTTPELDGRALDRLRRSDSQSRTYQDPYDAAEREQDELHARIDENYKGYIGEAGAHLVHAMKRDGMAPRLPLQQSLYIPAKAEKEIERADDHR
jgi:hypothetical protein